MGDAVFLGERIQAQAGGEAVLETGDSGYIALRPGSTFSVEQFAVNNQQTDHILIRLFQGGLRLLSGRIAQRNPKGYRLFTPTATIGIRGTDHEPFVVTELLASAMGQPAGTYDKVNRGGITLQANNRSVDIDPGRVGFVPLAKRTKNRALMTLMMPVLLDKVPEFYVPGQFDGELDLISSQEVAVAPPGETAGTEILQSAAQAQGIVASAATTPAGLDDGQCNASGVAKAWLARLDAAIFRGDAAAVLDLFAANVQIQSVVKDQSGSKTTLNITRDEFASSTITMMKSLTDFKQIRPSVVGRAVSRDHCNTIAVESQTIEQGLLKGRTYRFSSLEEYQLELKDGHWVATQAKTTQQ
ncbi:MAG: hypothetical protein KA254_03080 [Rhodoferax sp.]|nr:hypothetical protein [Rhodoferax sp.]